ncbi:MAG: ketoacyl-ACP synthase III [Acholeplasmatales bacterium]|nr:ketoacyl-ACP synthase III [Acholeplasmatales bacterium]
MSGIKIVGYGHFVPETTIYNDDFKAIIDTSDEWISSRTGIKERRVAVNETTTELALRAAKMALEDSKVDPSEIGLVITATMSPDSFTPSTSSKLLGELGIKQAMAFDISAACSGFVYALNIATALLNQNNKEYAIVIGTECLSELLDYSDRTTCVLFGDGAGAVVIKKTADAGYFYAMSKTDTENILYAKAIRGNDLFLNSKSTDYHLRMDGRKVYKFALDAVSDAISQVLEMSGLNVNDIDLFIPHQANERIIMSVCKHFDLDFNKFYLNLERYGNTSAASIPIALSEAYHGGKIKPGNRVLLVGFGAGLTWASTILKI